MYKSYLSSILACIDISPVKNGIEMNTIRAIVIHAYAYDFLWKILSSTKPSAHLFTGQISNKYKDFDHF